MRGMSVILRGFAGRRAPRMVADEIACPLFISAIAPTSFQPALLNHFRGFSTPPSSGPSKMVSIESIEQFNDSLRKTQDESLTAIFYFTAVWCCPSRSLSPLIGVLSEKYPDVTTYEVDIDKEGLGDVLGNQNLNIHSVPTLHFYKDGKKSAEVAAFGAADVDRLEDAMEASQYKHTIIARRSDLF